MAAPGLSLQFWGLEGKIRVALEHAGNTHTVEDVWALIRTGRLQQWVSPSGRSLLLTEIVDLPSEKALHHFLAAGVLKEVLKLRRVALEHAKHYGCTMEIITGRPGWDRVVRREDSGWNAPQIQISRRLS